MNIKYRKVLREEETGVKDFVEREGYFQPMYNVNQSPDFLKGKSRLRTRRTEEDAIDLKYQLPKK